jgi:hypothetical protein
MTTSRARLVLSSADLSEAIEYMEALIAPEAAAWPDVVCRALKVSAVVTYARPFSGNQNEAGKKERVKVGDYVTDAQDMAVHGKAITLRDTLLAHTDFSAKPNDGPHADASGTVSLSITLYDSLDDPLDIPVLLCLARSIRERMDRQRAIVIPQP